MRKKRNIKTNDDSIINWELHQKLRSQRLNKQILRINLGALRIRLVFRHRFEKYMDLSDTHSMWGKWELGMWFKKSMCIGTKYTGKNMFSKNNLFPDYTVGVNLLWFKVWMTVSWNVLEFRF